MKIFLRAITFLILGTAFLQVSCNDEGNNEGHATLSIEPNEIEAFSFVGGIKDYVVTTNAGSWDHKVTQGDWLTALKSGNNLTLIAQRNDGTTDQTATLTITAPGAETLTFTVKQGFKGGDEEIPLSAHEMKFYYGETALKVINVEKQIAVTAEVIEGEEDFRVTVSGQEIRIFPLASSEPKVVGKIRVSSTDHIDTEITVTKYTFLIGQFTNNYWKVTGVPQGGKDDALSEWKCHFEAPASLSYYFGVNNFAGIGEFYHFYCPNNGEKFYLDISKEYESDSYNTYILDAVVVAGGTIYSLNEDLGISMIELDFDPDTFTFTPKSNMLELSDGNEYEIYYVQIWYYRGFGSYLTDFYSDLKWVRTDEPY